MLNFKRATPPRQTLMRFFMGVGGVLVLALITAVAGRAAWAMYGKFQEAALADAQAQTELQTLKAQDAQVSTEVSELSTPRGVEAQVRERFGVEKLGEGVIQIVNTDASSTATTTTPRGWLSRTWSALFGWL
jgi:cell division protein FtsB